MNEVNENLEEGVTKCFQYLVDGKLFQLEVQRDGFCLRDMNESLIVLDASILVDDKAVDMFLGMPKKIQDIRYQFKVTS